MVRAFFFFLIVVFLNPLAGIAEKVSQEEVFLEVIKPENDNSEEKLLEIIRSLANEGEPNAQAELGVRYLIGNGVSKNSAEAFKWFHLAAKQKNAFGQHNLGLLYVNGIGVDIDFVEAAKWFRLAAEQGLPLAQYHLGVLYHGGKGVPKELKETAKWFRLAG